MKVYVLVMRKQVNGRYLFERALGADDEENKRTTWKDIKRYLANPQYAESTAMYVPTPFENVVAVGLTKESVEEEYKQKIKLLAHPTEEELDYKILSFDLLGFAAKNDNENLD